MIQLEIDGIKCSVPEHYNIIEAACLLNIIIPRFCYHKKLTIAANCRMCLVEIYKMPKLAPACTVKVVEGMRVFTTSPLVLKAQKDVMEFLLINHPLDCPICDQGGECELQDISLRYGNYKSRFLESKRLNLNEDFGMLIETSFNRCILCTRCVRFGIEVAGIREIGIIGRGVHSRVSTFVSNIVKSGLSGNVIDLCPVGALTSKPFKFKARPWEMLQYPAISPHDCIGSNLYLHVKDDTIYRVVPRENDLVNEVWISDRDRFSYEGMYSSDRLLEPMYKEGDFWKTVSWDFALTLLAEKLKTSVKDNVGAIISPNSTVEEFYLFKKLLSSIGIENIDSDLKRIDYRESVYDKFVPGLSFDINSINSDTCILLVGSTIYREQPVLVARLNKLTREGGRVCVINDTLYDYPFPVFSRFTVDNNNYIERLLKILKALYIVKNLDFSMYDVFRDIDPGVDDIALVKILLGMVKCELIIGESVITDSNFSVLYNICTLISKLLLTKVSSLTYGTNASGAWLTGCGSNRKFNNKPCKGKNSPEMFNSTLDLYFLVNIEPNVDFLYKNLVMSSLRDSSFVVCLTPYKTKFLEDVCSLLLPTTLTYETSGTFINTLGLKQTFSKAVGSPGNAKQTWTIFNILGKMLNIPGFSYNTIENVLQEYNTKKSEILDNTDMGIDVLNTLGVKNPYFSGGNAHEASFYRSDFLVRRAKSLQEHVRLLCDNT